VGRIRQGADVNHCNSEERDLAGCKDLAFAMLERCMLDLRGSDHEHSVDAYEFIFDDFDLEICSQREWVLSLTGVDLEWLRRRVNDAIEQNDLFADK
jgi:hypothetical protein